MEIRSISQKIFKTGQTQSQVENNSRQTNPFGVNFQGNIIKADVFEKKNEVNNFKGRLANSAIVGSLSSINKRISQRLDSVVNAGRDLGRAIKSNVLNAGKKVSNFWTDAKNTDISLGFPTIHDLALVPNEIRINNFSKKEVAFLGNLLEDRISLKLGENR